MFTGDIEYNAQKRLYERYNSITKDDEPYKIDLIKMPHHGSYEESLYALMRTFMPDYAIFLLVKAIYMGTLTVKR